MGDQQWRDVLDAAEVPAGAIRAVEIGELDLVVWRGVGGRACAMEARCPHQWSHLEAEGVVDGDEVLCTAHYWRFDGEGRGTKVNVHGRRDPKADIAVYPCRERNGRIEVALTDAPS